MTIVPMQLYFCSAANKKGNLALGVPNFTCCTIPKLLHDMNSKWHPKVQFTKESEFQNKCCI